MPLENPGVTGPTTATDNAVTRFDGTSGSVIQNSAATVDDSGVLRTTRVLMGRTGSLDDASTIKVDDSTASVGPSFSYLGAIEGIGPTSGGSGVVGKGSTGVTGIDTNPIGNGTGVYGSSSIGVGVFGVSVDLFGTYGRSTNAYGLVGQSDFNSSLVAKTGDATNTNPTFISILKDTQATSTYLLKAALEDTTRLFSVDGTGAGYFFSTVTIADGTASTHAVSKGQLDAKVSDTSDNAGTWDAVTTIAPSKNAVRDQVETMNTTISGKEPAITAGTTSQYWRGDKSFQTLNATAVGLGNVTNDAQVKASIGTAKGDLIGFTASATPANVAVGTNGLFLKADSTAAAGVAWAAPTASVAISSASIAFTDGDTLRRVTISDAAVTATSKIVGNIRRPDTTDDSADQGFIYIPTIVKVATGSFDLLIACLDWGFGDATETPPNETITYYYTIA